MKWMLMPYRKLYALIEGRSCRREYWMFVLLNLIIFAGFVALFASVVGFSGAAFLSAFKPGSMGPGSMAGAFPAMMAGAGMMTFLALLLPMYLWAIATGVAAFAVTVRRLHDLNLSGWFYLLYFVLLFIPLVNVFVWIGMIVVTCLPGTSGPNRYGADPLRSIEAEVFA